jgi:hypothetical protein
MATKEDFQTREQILGSVQMEVESLISGRQKGDSRLYDAILLLNNQLEKITQRLSPLVRKAIEVEKGVSELLAPVSFVCFSTGIGVRFTWSQVTYASQYEVRQGTVWETASFRFRTTGLQGNIDPLVYGAYNFLIKVLDSEGNYSADANHTSITVPQILAPAVNASVIDNNVLLSWTEPTSLFKIDYYLVEKEGAGVASGKVQGTFTALFELLSGVYRYYVTAVDVAGNYSARALAEVQVSQPPDFGLQDRRVSGLNGTRVNILRFPTRPSLLCCWNAQTWHEHFRVLRDWMDIEDQITAGYPIYIQPASITGSYSESIDYGTVINNTIVTITWNTIEYTPLWAMNIVVRMQVSNDNTTWSAWTEGASQYFKQLRYLNIQLVFTAENDKCFIELYNLTISLNVKRENDGGEVNAVATDVGGTVVTFNKPFKDIESITCTTKSTTEPYIVIFDFQDIPNPPNFKVYVFDTMGARVTKVVDWKVRGVI